MWPDVRLLLIDDLPQRRHDLAVILDFLGESYHACSSVEALSLTVPESPPVLTAVLLGSIDGRGCVVRLLRQLGSQLVRLPPILLLGQHDTSDWPDALRRRVLVTLEIPFSYNSLLDALHRAQVYQEMFDSERERGVQREVELFRVLVGHSRAIQKVRQKLQQLEGSEISVLLTGEFGSGKEVVARNLHYYSPRREQPFVPLDCRFVDVDLLASELFGHEVGAFPGALTQRKGRLELANGGTLFLYEVAKLPMDVQGRLLRALQERCFTRLGGSEYIPLNVRIITGTQAELESLVAADQFLDPLYYELSKFVLDLPPLRERAEDIPLLINELITRLEHEHRGSIRFNSAALMSLCRHDWRGNILELASLIERLTIMYPHGVIGVDKLPRKFQHLAYSGANETTAAAPIKPATTAMPGTDLAILLPVGGLDLKEYLNQIEQSLIQQALDDAAGVVARAAERLRVRRTTLVEKMRKYGITRIDLDGEELN